VYTTIEVSEYTLSLHKIVVAIQESFLQRDGLIVVGPDQIELHVEQKGIDVLMNELLWNLSIIKLP
jgi:hypothetical protein